jgi:hypothetical protein
MAPVMSEAEITDRADRLDSIRDVERLLLEAASAIQRLVSERDELRRRVEILESETTSLRERTLLMQESYRRLTTEFVTQLQLLDTGANDLEGR